MAQVPNQDVEVFFGEPDKPERDWREYPADSEPDDDDARPLTAEERDSLRGLLGFDPSELWGQDLEENDDEQL